MRPAVFFRLRLRLSLQNTADLLNPDSLTKTGTMTGRIESGQRFRDAGYGRA